MKLSKKYLPATLALASLAGCAKQSEAPAFPFRTQQEIIDRHNEAGAKAQDIIDETKIDLNNAIESSNDFERVAQARVDVINNPVTDGQVFYVNGKAIRAHVATLCIDPSTGNDNKDCLIPVGTEVSIIGSIDRSNSKEYVFMANTHETIYFPEGEASVKRYISCGENPSQDEKRYGCRFMPKE